MHSCQASRGEQGSEVHTCGKRKSLSYAKEIIVLKCCTLNIPWYNTCLSTVGSCQICSLLRFCLAVPAGKELTFTIGVIAQVCCCQSAPRKPMVVDRLTTPDDISSPCWGLQTNYSGSATVYIKSREWDTFCQHYLHSLILSKGKHFPSSLTSSPIRDAPVLLYFLL